MKKPEKSEGGHIVCSSLVCVFLPIRHVTNLQITRKMYKSQGFQNTRFVYLVFLRPLWKINRIVFFIKKSYILHPFTLKIGFRDAILGSWPVFVSCLLARMRSRYSNMSSISLSPGPAGHRRPVTYLDTSHARRKDQSLVIAMYHRHYSNCPCGEPPRVLVNIHLLLQYDTEVLTTRNSKTFWRGRWMGVIWSR